MGRFLYPLCSLVIIYCYRRIKFSPVDEYFFSGIHTFFMFASPDNFHLNHVRNIDIVTVLSGIKQLNTYLALIASWDVINEYSRIEIQSIVLLWVIVQEKYSSDKFRILHQATARCVTQFNFTWSHLPFFYLTSHERPVCGSCLSSSEVLVTVGAQSCVTFRELADWRHKGPTRVR